MTKVAVLGDIIIDKYIYGTSTRISPEAPVPVVSKKTEKETLGGAGNVFNNLKSLGVDCTLIDIQDKKSIKTRIFCDNHYVTRLDEDYIQDGDLAFSKIKNLDFSQYKFVVLSDYNKGVLSKAPEIIKHINSFGCKVIVDPKQDSLKYNGAWLIKANAAEYNKYKFDNWKGNIIVTDAGEPLSATIDDLEYTYDIDSVEVSDVTGAGDCFIAAFVYSLLKNYSYEKCLSLASKAATESVKHIGTYILTKQDLEDKVIFTNGCFDILHVGHLSLLQRAKQLGNKLVVGINSDASVKRLKGTNRPINSQQVRKQQLELLPWVDEVIVFDEDTPYKLIEQLTPDIIVKGGDYQKEDVVGNDIAEVHIFPLVDGFSSTIIIDKTK